MHIANSNNCSTNQNHGWGVCLVVLLNVAWLEVKKIGEEQCLCDALSKISVRGSWKDARAFWKRAFLWEGLGAVGLPVLKNQSPPPCW